MPTAVGPTGSNRDPREALALVGNALAATHDARALMPLILEVVTEATGARGGELVQGGVQVGWFGEVAGRHPLELDLTTGEHEDGLTTLLLYPPRRGFRKETRDLAEWLAAQAGIALENARAARARSAAGDDGRAHGPRQPAPVPGGPRDRARAGQAVREPLSLVLADLDDFKLVNDRHGHLAGDHALQTFGASCGLTCGRWTSPAGWAGRSSRCCFPRRGRKRPCSSQTACVERPGARATRAASVARGSPLTASFGIAELTPGKLRSRF